MKIKEEYLFGVIILLFAISLISALGSTNYNISNPFFGSGGNMSSDTYATGLVIEQFSGNMSSDAYRMGVGLHYSSSIEINTTNVSLNKGWNLVSFEMRKGDTATDRNISVSSGWNLISHSSDTNVSLEDVKFIADDGTSYTWANAIANSKVQAYLAYYDSSSETASERKYKYVATSDLGMDSTVLTKGNGYWLHTSEAGNLTLPGVGGSYSNETYAWDHLMFYNGSETKSISDADTAGWINNTLRYWDPSEGASGGFDTVCEDILSCDAVTLDSWKGYFIYSNYDDMRLIRQN